MPLPDLFCPACQRFVGDKDKCRYCDWVRPVVNSRVGTLRWQTPGTVDAALPGAPPFSVQITPANGLVFVPTEAGDIIAYDAETGGEVWRRTLRADRLLRTHAVTAWQDVLLIGCEHLGTLPTRDRALLAWRMSDAVDAWSLPTNGDSLSAPLALDDVAYFTSSEPRLFALDLVTRQMRWSVSAFSASPDAPTLFDQTLVVPSRGPQIAAYSSLTGERLWVVGADDPENEWLNYPPVVTADLVYASGWNRQNQLYAIDRATGEVRWRFKPERGFTCPPTLAGDTLLIGVKDYRRTGGDRKAGYGLCALDAATGALRWRSRTDKYLQVAPAVIEAVVLIGADDRRLRAINLADGSERWQIALPDKVRGRPVVIGDTVIVGLRNDALACVWWQADRPARPDPQTLLEQDRPLDAAAAYAAQGNLDEAACLLERHEHWREAAELWREADRLAEAAAAYANAEDYHQALDLYRQLNNPVAQARILIQQGKHAEAAALYEDVGDLELAVQEYRAAGRQVHAAGLLERAHRHDEAAQLYAEAHEYDQAAEEFIKANQFVEAAAIYLQLKQTEAAIGVLIQGGLLIEAAQLNEQLGRRLSAAELYERAARPDRAVALYESIQDWSHVARLAEALHDRPRLAEALVKQKQFARAAEVYEQAHLLDKALDLAETLKDWDRTARLAGQLNLWERQARAYREQGLITQAGEAYERAAAQLPADTPEAELARLYDAATQCYGEEDTEVRRYEACLDRVCQYRHLPNLRGRFDLKRPFYADEQNEVYFLVSNQGYGVARAIQVVEISSKFQLASDESQVTITRLSPQQDKTLRLMLQAKPNVRGRLMLKVVLAYVDRDDAPHITPFEYVVEVVAHDEKLVAMSRSSMSDTRPNIIVQGDYIGGGGQKGDKVELNRGGGRRIEVSDEAVKFERPREIDCPNCGRQSPISVMKCPQCGTALIS